VITIFCRSLSCDKSLYGLFKGTPSARQTVLRPWPDSCTARGSTSGIALNDRGCRALAAGVAGESRRCWAAAWHRASSATGAPARGRCRDAVSPAPGRWRFPPSRTPGGRTYQSGRAVLPRRASCRRAYREGRRSIRDSVGASASIWDRYRRLPRITGRCRYLSQMATGS